MAIADGHHQHHHHHKWGLCPFWQSATQSSSSSSTQNLYNQSQNNSHQNGGVAPNTRSSTVSSVARSLLPARRRLRLDPSSNLYFPCALFSTLNADWLIASLPRVCGIEVEPGKQARSAVRIKNSSKSHIAFKFQTTAPKSCYMRPPGGILAPGESLIATVFKFVEHPENNEKPINQKSRVKFKIMSLKVKEGTDYVPELDVKSLSSVMDFEHHFLSYFHNSVLFGQSVKSLSTVTELTLFDEQRDQVTVERILRVVFLDPERANPALEKLKRQLAEADAALEARKKPPADTGPKVVGEGLVIDEWKERREKYLARQQVEAVNSV
ncbi:hypothetical protein DH2020_011686 [Rehmannia glutinosa]|uniref:MSP domain-containing protein n=1 Tax=Rehmannia glutinosa TaxID=99300 RepID=A0ABR0XEP2_REHGL